MGRGVDAAFAPRTDAVAAFLAALVLFPLTVAFAIAWGRLNDWLSDWLDGQRALRARWRPASRKRVRFQLA